MGLLHFIFGNPAAERLKDEVALLRRDKQSLMAARAEVMDRLDKVSRERNQAEATLRGRDAALAIAREVAREERDEFEKEATALRARVNELERCLQSVGRLLSVCKDPVKAPPAKDRDATTAPAMPMPGERVVFGFTYPGRTAMGRVVEAWPQARLVKIRADDGLLFVRTLKARGAAGGGNDWCEVVT